MGINLINIMKLEALKDAKVLVGADKLNNIVTGITIMEAPDIADWMKEGQILLSSLYSLSEEEESQREFIRKLAHKKISALIIKSRNKSEVSSLIIEECINNNLTLIKIPESVPYTKIMYPVLGELFDSQVNRVNYFKKCHDKFMKIALENKGINAIAQGLSETIEKGIIIYDTNKNVLASNVEGIKDHESLSFQNSQDKFTKGNLSYFKQEIILGAENIKSIAIPIRALKQTKCYISIIGLEEEIDELEFIAVENASTMLSLEMVKQLAVAEIEQKFKNDLIDDLLSGNIASKQTIFERADLIGWNIRRPYSSVIFKVNKIGKCTASEFENNEDFMMKIKHMIDNIIGHSMGTFLSEHITRIKNDTIIILWPYDNKIDKEKNFNNIKNICVKLQKESKKTYNLTSLEVGIGGVSNSIDEMQRSYNEAKEALKFGQIIHGQDSIESFENLGVYRLLCRYSNKEDLHEFIPKTLNSLLQYDQKNGSDLTNTLEVFINCDCNASQAAQELFIHYKTLLYRINKIKSIMNVDFLNGEHKLDIQIGLKILRILGLSNKKYA